MTSYDRVSVLIGLTAIGLGFSLRLSSPNGWYLLVAVCLLIFWGNSFVILSYPLQHGRNRHSALMFSILSAVLVLGLGVLLHKTATVPWQALGVIITLLFLAVVLWSEYHTVVLEDRRYNTARFILNMVSYMAAFGIYAALYFYFRLPGLHEALIVGTTSALLASDLLRHPQHKAGRIWIYSAIAGLVMGETQWGLKYLSIEGVIGPIFLLLMFYLVTGIIQSNFAGKLSRARVAEYSMVTLVGLALLFSSHLWAG